MSQIHYIIFIFNLLVILLVENVKCREARIHHGMQADNSFNYVVKIVLEDYEKIKGNIELIDSSTCTGSLVTNQHVITAAHCVKDSDNTYYPGKYRVFSGAIDLDSPNGTWTLVKEIYVPSYYTNDYDIGDIAVLKLERPLSSDKISTLKVPKSFEEPPSGRRAVVAGYGIYSDLHFDKRHELDGKEPKILQYAVSEILSEKECKAIHKPHDDDDITDYHLCARMVPINEYNTYRGVCSGDSGGPLVMDGVLIGVVSYSFSESCDESRRPQVYTKVSHFVNFIINAVNGHTEDLCVGAHIPKTTAQIEVLKNTYSLMEQCDIKY